MYNLQKSMKLSKLFVACSIALVGVSAAHANLTASAFTGGAIKPFTEVTQKIGKATVSTSTAIEMSTQNTVSAIHASGAEVSKSVLSAASKSSTDSATMSQMQTKLEMDYLGTLEANRMQAKAQLRKGETAAELKAVEDFLRKEDIKHLNINEAIDYAKQQLDGKVTVVEPPPLDKKGVCDDGKCGFERVITPSLTIAAYAEMCAETKQSKTKQAASTAAENRTNIDSARKSQQILDGSTSGAAQSARLSAQITETCTPNAVERGLCGEITKDEYVDKVLKNQIIPNGGVSAVNLYAPSSVGGAGLMDLEDPSMQKMVKLVELDALEKTTGGKKDLPEIVQTYRNSSQLKAAENFVDNIVNLDAVANQPANERKKPSSVKFQTQFMSRAAQLDLAKNTLNQSVAERRGQKLSKVNTSSLKEGEVIKEIEDGAAPIDLKWHDIQQDMKKVSAENIAAMTEMTENQILLETYKALVKKNSAQFDRLIRLERQSLLLSAILAAKANSPENIEHLKKLGE